MSNPYPECLHYLPSADFYIEVSGRIKQCAQAEHSIALLTLDFDNFNYINDLFSYEMGDTVLRLVVEHFSKQLRETDVFSKIHADHFLFCVSFKDFCEVEQLFEKLANLHDTLTKVLPHHYSMVVSCGALVVEDETALLSTMLDKANYARKKSKGNTVSTLSLYDAKMSKEVLWQKTVTLTMESALQNHEFEMYLQPKVLIKDGHAVGAEALVRWNSPEHGFISPDKFIPIMERNGFIRRLDFFMLEEACRFLKQCEERGIPVLPISVNFSKAHLTTQKLATNIFQTVRAAGVSPHLIEIEFTESLSIESYERLVKIISELKLFGFRVCLDDFGSDYSSLNCLKDLSFDIIKIDKNFLEVSANAEKSKGIIAKVVELIKSLRLLSVMEGVESLEHVQFLQKLGCDIGQGFYYAKPLPVVKYLEFLKETSVSADMSMYAPQRGEAGGLLEQHAIPHEFQMDNWELYTLGKNIDMGLMKGYLDENVGIQYVNERALEYLGYTRQEFRDILHNSAIAFIHPEDIPAARQNIEQLIQTGKPLSFETRAICKNGTCITLRGQASCVIDNYGRPVGFYAFRNITSEQEHVNELQKQLHNQIETLQERLAVECKAKETLKIKEERCRIVFEQSNDILFDWDFILDTIVFSEKYYDVFGEVPIVEGLLNSASVRERIHEDDVKSFERWVQGTHKNVGYCEELFRIRDVKGVYLWMRCRATTMGGADGKPIRAVGVFSNVSAQKNAIDTLTIKSQRDPLTKLLNKEETQVQINKELELFPDRQGAFFIVDIDNFKGLNDSLGHQLGDTVLIELAGKIRKIFRETDIIGRIGGDEIACYIAGCDESAAHNKAKQLTMALRSTYYGATIKYDISGSVGVALYPEHGTTFQDLYYMADVALYESKREGKDRYTFYGNHMTGSLQDTRTPVEWSQLFLNTYFQNDFPFKIFEMLYETKDIIASVQRILEILGQQYNVDRVYIFQNDENNISISNTMEWCGPNILSEMHNLQNIPIHNLNAYYTQYSAEGIFSCPDIRYADEQVRALCEPQEIKSLLHCAIYDEGNMVGFIGFDMCSRYHEWTGEEIAILGYISRILSVFLIKMSMAAELKTSYKNYASMVENLNGYVYVVDSSNYNVLYINKNTESLGLAAGQPCYQMAFGANAPCVKCPINQFSDVIHYATEEIYSERLQCWVNSAASKVKWEGAKNAVLVCCTDITKYKTSCCPGIKA